MRLRTASGSAFQDPPDYGPAGKERTASRHLDRRVPHRRTATALRLFRVGRASGITRFAALSITPRCRHPSKPAPRWRPFTASSIMVSASGNTARLRFLAASLPAPGTAAVSTRMSGASALVRERQRSLLLSTHPRRTGQAPTRLNCPLLLSSGGAVESRSRVAGAWSSSNSQACSGAAKTLAPWTTAWRRQRRADKSQSRHPEGVGWCLASCPPRPSDRS